MRTSAVQSHQRGDAVFLRATSPAVEFVHVDGEAVVYHCESQSLHLLNAVATTIWLMFDRPATVTQTAERAGGHFGVPPESIHPDVLDLVADLARIKLLEEVTAP